MNKLLLTPLAMGVILWSAPATSFADPAAAAPAATKSASTVQAKNVNDPNKKICKTEDVIGSRLDTKRVCMTREQWDNQARDAGQSVSDAQRGH